MLHIAPEGQEHKALASMLQESMPEILVVARSAITSRKANGGCYGYPALLLLLAIADTIGTYVVGGNVEKHLSILNHPRYFDLRLSDADLKAIGQEYRGLLTHNSVLGLNHAIEIGLGSQEPIETLATPEGAIRIIRLVPLLDKVEAAVATFLGEDLEELVLASSVFREIKARQGHSG